MIIMSDSIPKLSRKIWVFLITSNKIRLKAKNVNVYKGYENYKWVSQVKSKAKALQNFEV